MRIRQHAHFDLVSSRVSAADVTARLGIEPDAIMVRGSRRAEPPAPAFHRWQVSCRARGLTVDDQVGLILARLRPHAEAIAALAAELADDDPVDGGAVLHVVRYFGAADGEEEGFDEPDAALQKLPGQHQLLGWTLERDVLDFLQVTGAVLDVDEYG